MASLPILLDVYVPLICVVGLGGDSPAQSYNHWPHLLWACLWCLLPLDLHPLVPEGSILLQTVVCLGNDRPYTRVGVSGRLQVVGPRSRDRPRFLLCHLGFLLSQPLMNTSPSISSCVPKRSFSLGDLGPGVTPFGASTFLCANGKKDPLPLRAVRNAVLLWCQQLLVAAVT